MLLLNLRCKIVRGEECLGPLRGCIDGEMGRNISRGMAAHAVGDDPKIATVDRREHILIRPAYVPRLRSADAQPSRGLVHAITGSAAGDGRSQRSTEGGPKRATIC